MPGKPRICLFDANGLITDITARAEELVGFPPGAALGRHVTELFPFIDLNSEHEKGWEEVALERADRKQVRVAHSLLRTANGGGAIAFVELSGRESAVDELIESDRQNRLLFEQHPFPTWVYDIETLRFLDVNPAAIHHYGYSREEFLSMTLKDIRPSEDVPATVEAARRNALAFRSTGRWRHRRKDGQIITVDITATATTYRGRRAKLAVIQDVSDWQESQRKVAEATALIDAIVNTVPLAIWGIDLSGNVNFWNSKAEELFGWREAEVLGAPPPCLAPQELPGVANTGIDMDGTRASARNTSAAASVERKLHRKGGEAVYCDIWSAALRDPRGSSIGTIAVAADTTERRRGQEQLATYVQNLARSNDDLRQFAYAASHHLQEPLRNVRLFAELLGELQPADERAAEFRGHIQTGAKQIQELVDGLRKYWELGESVPDLQRRVDTGAVLKRVLAESHAALQAAGASVKVEPLPTLLGSERELATVFQELLSNAIRFRGQGRLQIEISARSSRAAARAANQTQSCSPAREWELCVRDNGIGIAPAYSDRIFEIFKRLSRAHEGIGLGLALVKRIIERHHGRIWVQSEEGQGSAFYFTWPAAGDEAMTVSAGKTVEARGME